MNKTKKMFFYSNKYLVLFSLWAARLVQQPTAPVQVSNGLVQGIIAPDGTHAAYFGIPYATVTERFQGPGPEPKWNGTFKAYNEHIRCTQRFTKTKVLGEDSCLTLNIYTPIQKADLLPVMVFIHGGGFRDGSGTPFLYGPKYLTKHDVILVTFNYRLEVLGFLCLGTKEAPGNAGLKDQVEALRWVKKNIQLFGGDPDNVTIFGESAGSASVTYHLISPMSKGLFQKAIMQSGSAMSPWSLQFDPLETARKLARQIGYDADDPIELYNIFKRISSDELLRYRVPRNEGDIVLSENIFVPCVEKKILGVERFLPDSPYNLFLNGQYQNVPVIIGYNSAEGYMFVGKENDTTLSSMDCYKSLPRDLIFASEVEKREIANNLEKYYRIRDRESLIDGMSKKERIAKLEGDTSIIFPTIATIDLFMKSMVRPVYAYKFSYDGWLNLAKLGFGFWWSPGATHADEIFYMFNVKVSLLPLTLRETEFINKMTAMWTNFAKYSDPTPGAVRSKWRPINKNKPQVLEINKECRMVDLWDDEMIKFWNSVYTKYRRKS